MKNKSFARLVFLAIAIVSCCAARAVPVAALTFDVLYYDESVYRGGPSLINDPLVSRGILTVEFPFVQMSSYYDANWNVRNLYLGSSGPSGGLVFKAGAITNVFDSSTQGMLNSLGFAVTANTSFSGFTSMQKRFDNFFPSPYETSFVATTFGTVGLTGAASTTVLASSLRIGATMWNKVGDVAKFTTADIPAMLKQLSLFGQSGWDQEPFIMEYHARVDSYSSGGVPSATLAEVDYKGYGQLIGFSVDGVDQLTSAIPEPSSFALLLLGMALVVLGVRRS